MNTAVLVTVLGLFQSRSIDWTVQPWRTVMDIALQHGDIAAQAELERIAAQTNLSPWQRAYAWRWAGRLAMRNERFAQAQRDFEAARAAEPGGFEARMAAVHLGELAIRQQRWYEADRWLSPLAHDPDPIIATYAADRLTAVRERIRRVALRWLSVAWLACTAIALAVRLWKRSRRNGVGASFARALLVTETLALMGGMVVPRATTSLATPGWMAFSIPAAVVVAAVWATRDPRDSLLQRTAHWTVVALALVAGLYLALDFTWWSVMRPVL